MLDFGGRTGNVHGSFMARRKARGRLPISGNWTTHRTTWPACMGKYFPRLKSLTPVSLTLQLMWLFDQDKLTYLSKIVHPWVKGHRAVCTCTKSRDLWIKSYKPLPLPTHCTMGHLQVRFHHYVVFSQKKTEPSFGAKFDVLWGKMGWS